MISRKTNWLAAACVTAAFCAAAIADAQDGGSAGIVRISDRKTPVQPASFHGHGNYGYVASGASAGYGTCPNGNCQNNCYSGCQHQFMGGVFQERYCKNSPDHGYSPPAKYPLHRIGAQYESYFPNQPYGSPGASYAGGFPIVYQPTDTSQMGYSYQHVPTWQPSTTIMPQRPIPANMHIVAPVVNASTFQGTGWTGYAPFGRYTPPFGGLDRVNAHYAEYGNSGYYYNSGMTNQSQGCPVPSQGTPSNQTPQPLPQTPQAPTPIETAPVPPTTAAPPSPRQFQDSAESGHLRRAAY